MDTWAVHTFGYTGTTCRISKTISLPLVLSLSLEGQIFLKMDTIIPDIFLIIYFGISNSGTFMMPIGNVILYINYQILGLLQIFTMNTFTQGQSATYFSII